MTLILECLKCGTRYESPPDFPPEGRKVRCARCGEIWHAVAREQLPEPVPPVDDDDDADNEIVFRGDDEDGLDTEAAAVDDEGLDDPAEGADDGEREAEPEPAEDLRADDAGDGADDAEGETEVTAEPPAEAAPAIEEEPEAETEPEEQVPSHPRSVIGRARPRDAVSRLGRSRQAGDMVTFGWVALMAMLFGLVYLAYDKRVAIVRALPGAAFAYEALGVPVNVRGLGFGPVSYSWAVEGGRPILEVEGEIRNITDRPLKVPTVVFALRNAVDVEVYQWAADVRSDALPGGERTLFLARIPSPPKSIESVQVRFAKSR